MMRGTWCSRSRETSGAPPEVSRLRLPQFVNHSRTVASRQRRPSACRRSEEHTSELQSLRQLVCRLLLEKKKNLRNVALARVCKWAGPRRDDDETTHTGGCRDDAGAGAVDLGRRDWRGVRADLDASDERI